MTAMKLQAWGLELHGRLCQVVVACAPHAALGQARTEARHAADPNHPRLVRLAHLDEFFAASPSVCFGCATADAAPRGPERVGARA